VTLNFTDNNNNSSSGTAVVTVEDNINPTVVTQDITIQLDATGNASITSNQIDNGSSDVCGIASLVLDKTNFTCADVGVNTVTLTVTDNNSNVNTATALVTVQESINPTVITQDITVQLDATGNVSITPAQIDNGSGDPCGLASLVLDKTDFSCADVGSNTVTLTVTDNNGNIVSGTAVVTVEDNINPNVVTQNINISLDATGNASIIPAQINNGSSDICGISSISLNQTVYTCADVGANTVTLKVTDNNNNISTW
jgi:hypothetical protein